MFPMTVSLTISNATQLQALTAIISGEAAQLPPRRAEVGGPTVVTPAVEKDEELGTTDETAGVAHAITGGKTLDDAKALTMKVVAAKGRDAAVELLAKFGVKVAAKLEAGQVDAFCAEAVAVLNG